MKKIICILACGMLFHTGMAQGLPKWANKARKAVFSVITYTADNKILNTGNGFYIDENGTAVSDYSLFKGADHAVVITADGKELPVRYIMGANDMYDVIKFKTVADKKIVALTMAPTGVSKGETVYLLPYATQKAEAGLSGTVAKVDSIGNQSLYYTLNLQATDKSVSCPVMNAGGEVLGLMQKSTDKDGKESYAIGVDYAAALSISALSFNDYTLNTIGIKKGLPEDESQALVYLYMASSQLKAEDYLNLLNDFIGQYPQNMEGYIRRATYYINTGAEADVALAEDDIKKAEEVSAKKDEAHYQIAKLIHSYVVNTEADKRQKGWDYERALSEVNQALEAAQEPIYYQLQGDIYFAMQKYPEAYGAYEQVNKSNLASAASYYAAAKAKELTEGSDKKEVIALLDSAVSTYNQPYGQEAAPYIYERARLKLDSKMYREAVIDYNLFHDAMMGRVSAEFYLIREQAEMQCRMYQQAINDINKAIEMDPSNAGYWAEKGGIHLRLNRLEEAIQALEKALTLNPDEASTYRMLGYAELQHGKKKEGLAHLQKASEMGDTVAGELIEKYGK